MAGVERPSSDSETSWIEASRPLHPGIPVWPSDREFELDQQRERITISDSRVTSTPLTAAATSSGGC